MNRGNSYNIIMFLFDFWLWPVVFIVIVVVTVWPRNLLNSVRFNLQINVYYVVEKTFSIFAIAACCCSPICFSLRFRLPFWAAQGITHTHTHIEYIFIYSRNSMKLLWRHSCDKNSRHPGAGLNFYVSLSLSSVLRITVSTEMSVCPHENCLLFFEQLYLAIIVIL